MNAEALVLEEIQAVFRQRRRQTLIRAGAILAALVLLYFACIYAYAAVVIARAKDAGVYATVEEAAIATWNREWLGAAVTHVDLHRCSPSNPHDDPDDRRVVVWLCLGRIDMAQNPPGTDHSSFGTSSYFVRVRDGWVHMPEDEVASIVSGIMRLYHMEGIP